MRFFVLILMIVFPALSFAEQATRCNLTYFGDKDKFKGVQYSYMGIPSDSYLYTCSECGGIQISVYASSSSNSSYSFISANDFLKKISVQYNQRDIARLEMSGVSQNGKIKYSLLETGIADFYPIKEKISYLYFSAKQDNKEMNVGYSGFVISNGSNSCTIVATYSGIELSIDGRKSLSYFMNHITI